MPSNHIAHSFDNEGNRNSVRRRVIEEFLKEKAGTGNKEKASKYEYQVETLANGNHIILTRPANLKNGFDFLIRVSNHNFNRSGRLRDNPKHDDLIDDLKVKKNNEPKKYKLLYEKICKVYQCKNVTSEELKIEYEDGLPADLIVLVCKWFFIEQDIRYWNYSGRNMLFSNIPKPIGGI